MKADNFKFECKVNATDTEIETKVYELPATVKATITHFYPGGGRELTIYDTADPTTILAKVPSFQFTPNADDPKYYDAEATYSV